MNNNISDALKTAREVSMPKVQPAERVITKETLIINELGNVDGTISILGYKLVTLTRRFSDPKEAIEWAGKLGHYHTKGVMRNGIFSPDGGNSTIAYRYFKCKE